MTALLISKHDRLDQLVEKVGEKQELMMDRLLLLLLLHCIVLY